MTEISVALNGYTDVPNDKVAYIVTYLQMLQKPTGALKVLADVTLERWEEIDVDAYCALYKEIGEQWLWFSRLQMPREELKAMLEAPETEIYSPVRDGRRLGLFELNRVQPDEVEISFFGLVPDAIGGGLGRWLMMSGLARVWEREGLKRVWLHTCTGDSPQAIHFYQSCGFKPYKRAIELADDPRLEGGISPEAGRHVPFLVET